jgi:hypothetical protein
MGKDPETSPPANTVPPFLPQILIRVAGTVAIVAVAVVVAIGSGLQRAIG